MCASPSYRPQPFFANTQKAPTSCETENEKRCKLEKVECPAIIRIRFWYNSEKHFKSNVWKRLKRLWEAFTLGDDVAGSPFSPYPASHCLGKAGITVFDSSQKGSDLFSCLLKSLHGFKSFPLCCMNISLCSFSVFMS